MGTVRHLTTATSAVARLLHDVVPEPGWEPEPKLAEEEALPGTGKGDGKPARRCHRNNSTSPPAATSAALGSCTRASCLSSSLVEERVVFLTPPKGYWLSTAKLE